MTNSVTILGASGRFGRAATAAFLQRGWQVTVVSRARDSGTFVPRTSVPRTFVPRTFVPRTFVPRTSIREPSTVYADIFDAASLAKAVGHSDVIVNALNPPYRDWQRDLPCFTQSLIHAAKHSSATVMIPGNIYNYGAAMPERLTEETPHVAATNKGLLRIQMERAYAEAAEQGVQTIILRGGDFIEKRKTGNWFDSYMVNRVEKNLFTYPGALDKCHAWAYLPDMAEAMVQLAELRTELATFDEFGYEGFNVTGQDMINSIERVLGTALRVKKMPWNLIQLMSLFSKDVREVMEMRYLWDTPHSIDGAKLSNTLPELRPRSVEQVMAAVLNK